MIENLQALVAVVELKSLTKAAKRLFITQSAVSRRLQQLEQELSTELFDRAQRPPAPTAIALRVYEYAVPILGSVSELRAVAKESGEPKGILRLGVAQGIGDVVLGEVTERLQRTYPNLGLRLRTDWSAGINKQVIEGALDAGLVLMPFSSKPTGGLSGRYVSPVETVIIQAAKRDRFTRPLKLEQLSKEGWILNPLGCGFRSAIEAAMGGRQRQLRVVIDAYGTDLQLRMVAAGRGLGLVPRAILKVSPTAKRVVPVEVSDFSLALDAWVVHRAQLGNLRRAVDILSVAARDAIAPNSSDKPRKSGDTD